jgi:hypothetical protein
MRVYSFRRSCRDVSIVLFPNSMKHVLKEKLGFVRQIFQMA